MPKAFLGNDPDDQVTDHPASETGGVPVRNDKRGVLHMLHDEIGKALGIGQAKDIKVGTDGKGLMDAVNDAVGQASTSDNSNP